MAILKEFTWIIAVGALSAALFAPASAQTFDTSGNAKLKGDFFVRQVITTKLDSTTSTIGRAVSITGIMNFDGNGHYTFNGQKVDYSPASGTLQPAMPYVVSNGTYAVESNGMAQISDPIDSTDAVTEVDYGAVTGVGPVSIVASSTEGAYNDVFVAIQAGSGVSNASLNGTYNVGFIDFQQASISQVRDGYYTLTSTGNGNLGSVTVSGALPPVANANNNVQQTFAGVTYSITNSEGAGTLTFPTASSPATALVSGQKTFYVSADGSLLLGGDPNGFDLILGVKASSAAAGNSTYKGTYYNAALEYSGSGGIDSFYGSTLALGIQNTTISHERLSTFNAAAYDYTTDASYNFASDGTYNDGTYQYFLALGGKAALIVGTGSTFSLSLNLWAPSSPATSVFIDPLSIFNAASYAPITNPVAPGEFVSIFGSGLAAATASAQSLPLSTKLGNVQVTVNGRPAPLQYVSAGQINLLIPNETSEPYATFQVNNNGVLSNLVTVYTNLTAPGAFTLSSSGAGPAALLHLDYSPVTSDNPATPGETLVLYLTGLGAATPPLANGAAGPADPPSTANELSNIGVDIYDSKGVDSNATVGFAGPAPGFAGVDQINFTVPNGVASGAAYLGISTNEAYSDEAQLFIK